MYTLALIGNGDPAVLALDLFRTQLADSIQVVLVVTEPNDSGVDGFRLSFRRSAMDAGFEEGTTLFSSLPHAPEVLSALDTFHPDCILSVQCTTILRKDVIQKAKKYCLNVHNAPLPLLRGCDPFAWAIYDGLQSFGISLHQVPHAGVDDGAVFAQRFFDIAPDMTAYDLYLRSNREESVELLRENLVAVLDDTLKPIPQEPHLVSYHPMRQFPFRRLCPLESCDFKEMSASGLSMTIRAVSFPAFQTAHSTIGEKYVGIVTCETADVKKTDLPLDMHKFFLPNRILAVEVGEEYEKPGIVVKCKLGALRILRLCHEGGIEWPLEEAIHELGFIVGGIFLDEDDDPKKGST